MSGVIVRIEHARAARIAGQGVMCASGIRAWFHQHNLSLTDFLRDGLPEDVLLKTECPFAIRAIEIAKLEACDGR